MAERIPQSVTIRVPLQAYLSSDHVSAATGLTIAITISQNGGAYANPSGGATNATEIASGSYYVDLSTTDTGTLGPLFVKGTSATMDTIIAIYNVVSATTLGASNLDAAISTRMATYTQPTGFLTATFPSGTIANTTNITSAAGCVLTSSYDFAKGTVAMTEAYPALNATLTPAQALYSINQQLGQQSIAGTTMTVLKRDQSTTAKTYTLNDATNPTGITEAS